MLIEREKLEEALEKTFIAIYGNKKIVDEFCNKMLYLHGVKIGDSMDIIGRNRELKSISKEFLVWITQELGEVLLQDESNSYLVRNIDIKRFFTDNEIRSFSKSKFIDDNERERFPIIIDRVLMVNQDQFLTVKPVDFIYDWRNKQILRYNFNTQREQTLKKTSTGFKFVMKIIKRAVREIKTLMLKGKFISNAITVNINDDLEHDFYYDEENMTLVINSATIDIIDGNHRYISMTDAKDENPDFKYNTVINITNFSEEKAKRFIIQENKRNVIAKSKIKSLDVDNSGSIIVNNLNESSKSNIRDMIGTSKNHLINFAILADAINYNFPIPNNQEQIKVKKFTLEAFNALTEDNIDLINSKVSDLQWLFYVRVMRKYYETNDINGFIDEVQRINNIDFESLSNSIKITSIGKKLFGKIDTAIANLK